MINKNNINYVLYSGSIFDILNDEKFVEAVDIKLEGISDFDTGRGCCEYLNSDEFISDDTDDYCEVGTFIVAIPLKYVKEYSYISNFGDYRSNDVKKSFCEQYINSINKLPFINCSIIKDEKLAKSLMIEHINESIQSDENKILNLVFENNLNKTSLSELHKDTVLSNDLFKELKSSMDKVVKSKYRRLLSKKDEYKFIINNQRTIDTGNPFPRSLYPILLKKKDEINNYRVHICENFINISDTLRSFSSSYEQLSKHNNSFGYNIQKKKLDLPLYHRFICDLTKMYYEFLLKHKIGSFEDNINNINYYDTLYRYYSGDLKIYTKDVKIKDYIYDKIKDEVLYVKIDANNAKTVFNFNHLLNLTLVRYLFFTNFNHIPGLYLNLLKSSKNMDVEFDELEAIMTASQFHQQTAWYRFNLMSSYKSSNYNLLSQGKIDIDSYEYYKVFNLKKFNNMLNTHDFNVYEIQSFFSNSKNILDLNKSEKISMFHKLSECYNKVRYGDIIKLFKSVSYKSEKKVDVKKESKIKKPITSPGLMAQIRARGVTRGRMNRNYKRRRI